jgi:hypothetical protein
MRAQLRRRYFGQRSHECPDWCARPFENYRLLHKFREVKWILSILPHPNIDGEGKSPCPRSSVAVVHATRKSNDAMTFRIIVQSRSVWTSSDFPRYGRHTSRKPREPMGRKRDSNLPPIGMDTMRHGDQAHRRIRSVV